VALIWRVVLDAPEGNGKRRQFSHFTLLQGHFLIHFVAASRLFGLPNHRAWSSIKPFRTVDSNPRQYSLNNH
jgi:hypothetical protein